MSFDAINQFLHAPEWEEFLSATGQEVARHRGALFIKGILPQKGSYWRGSRLTIDQDWHIPPFVEKAWFLRLEPLNVEAEDRLRRLGKLRQTSSIQPKQTVVLDLTQSEEALLAGMKSKHRYNIKVAERHEVKTEQYHEDSLAHFSRFWNLLTATAGRHTFRTHDQEHYKKMIETLAPKGMAHLAFATLAGEDLAALLLITCDKTVTYLHGGSANHRKEVMAPYLLHWKVIQWAKTKELRFYDLWGTNAIKTETGWEARSNHPSTGTTRFKLGFGGTVVNYPGTFDLVLKPIPYTLYNGIRRIIRRQSAF